MNDEICGCGHSINKHYLDNPSSGEVSGYCTHYDNENHVFCNCNKSPGDIAAALRARVEAAEELEQAVKQALPYLKNCAEHHRDDHVLEDVIIPQLAAALAVKGAG